jgi:hypothetical protein
MADDPLRCSGLLDGNVCAHGFRASIGCWPTSIEHAHRCAIPMCCDEERCGELFDNNGGKPFQQEWR